MLSGYVHPDLTEDAFASLEAGAIAHSRPGDPVKSVVLISSVCLLLLLEIAQSNFLKVTQKRDINFIVKKIFRQTGNLISSDSMLARMNVPPSVYKLFGFDIGITAND